MDKKLKSLGICVGASTITIVELLKNNECIEIRNIISEPHNGTPKQVLNNELKKFNLKEYNAAVTGRKFKNLVNCAVLPEPEAIEHTMKYLGLNGKYDTIASLGGENFIIYSLDKTGKIKTVFTGNKCASGTGEFFLQQIGRMDLPIEEALQTDTTDNPYTLSGRCSVFCKSDCTHALNKGIPKENVVSGLSNMIANKVFELLSKQKSDKIMLIGGVSSVKSIVKYIRAKYPDAYIPDEARYFEALGAGIYAFESGCELNFNNLFREASHRFNFLEALNRNSDMVEFRKIPVTDIQEGEECIIGLDVGSTTTKAVIISRRSNSVLASEYIRTNGNPVAASIECYRSLKNQVNKPIKIVGLGTTGSGRHIAALYSMTKSVINEIIAHSVAAAYFDKDVDTIFEIGGQDAKYTFLTNGIASDYAMNEACSAGTGSFLEEASKESLNIYYKDIADIAFQSKHPINFNDQCSAFISSDIKTASLEGLPKEDIVAGLVYSICMNYVNRVKGNRQVGKKIFMQGGVCYNKAVPYAMSQLLGKKIIVPPEPGLMGAFGVALEVNKRISLNLTEKQNFSLDELINREFKYKKEFICAGGAEKCDRKCSISLIEVQGKKYAFGGACNKYYNQFYNLQADTLHNNIINERQNLVFGKYIPNLTGKASQKTIGISKSFLNNTLYPLYYNYFTGLDFKVILSDLVDKDSEDKIRTSYCYPAEIAHGLFGNLLKKNPDYIFIPHISSMELKENDAYSRMCVFVQSESFYLKSSFASEIKSEILNPYIDFSKGKEFVRNSFIEIGKRLGKSEGESATAFDDAYEIYSCMLDDFKERGRQLLNELEKDKDKFALVLFGRAYNAFASEANLNIPHKFASKNILIIPHDFLPSDNLTSYENMYWYSGNQILRSARFVKNHKQLFGVYITNYSCGPDSFILPYFRKIMGKKPSLTLELDSHSADVGIDTRIEAAIDIIKNYIELNKNTSTEIVDETPDIRVLNSGGEIRVVASSGKEMKINSDNVEVLIPSMGHFSSMAFASVFKSLGVKSKPLPIPSFDTLKVGRGMTTCKECLPFILTTGSLQEYINHKTDNNTVTLFFMPHGFGPCRQGQYFIMLKDIIKNAGIKNVGVLTMNDETAFGDFGDSFFKKGWTALTIADVYHDIESAVMTLAVDRKEGLEIVNSEWEKICNAISVGNDSGIFSQLQESSDRLSKIKLKRPIEHAKVIFLTGEIYVRREEFSRGDLIHTLIDNDFVVKSAPITEYVYYSNYLIRKEILDKISLKEKIDSMVSDKYQKYIEHKVKKIFSKTGLYKYEMINVEKTIDYSKMLLSEKLIGETILTIGSSLREILDTACGVISIGPFNCIPSRVSDAILNKEMTLKGKYLYSGIGKNGYPENLDNLPFLFVESDGNPYPQITQSRIEIFMLQATRLHEMMEEHKAK